MAAWTTVTAAAVLSASVSPFPRYYRLRATHYRSNTAFFQFGPHYHGNYRSIWYLLPCHSLVYTTFIKEATTEWPGIVKFPVFP